MSERHIYAHWLDPDYLGEQAVPLDRRDERLREFEGILKLHAIVGDSICISDVQLVESRLLLHLFQNPSFIKFVKRHPDFLRLIATPTDRFGAKSDRMAILDRGLVRIMELGTFYTPRCFDSPDTLRLVATMFNGVSNEAEAQGLFSPRGRFSRFVQDYVASDRPFVVGLHNILDHFTFNRQVVVQAPQIIGDSSTYYRELENVYEQVGPDHHKLRDVLSQTLNLAQTADERTKRGRVYGKLPSAAISGHPDREKYLTVIQAWNVAVGRTIGADSDSAYCFRDAFPIPVHSGTTSDCSTFVTRTAQEQELFATLPHYSWHPSTIDWDTLATIRANCAVEIAKFQDSLRGVLVSPEKASGMTAADKLAPLMDAAGHMIAAEHRALPPPPAWVVTACEATELGVLTASVCFGLSLSEVWPALTPGLVKVYELISAALKRADAREIGAALQAYGLQYNLHRTSAAV